MSTNIGALGLDTFVSFRKISIEKCNHMFSPLCKYIYLINLNVSYIIIWTQPFNLENIELFILFHVRLHRFEAFLGNIPTIGPMEEHSLSQELFHLL